MISRAKLKLGLNHLAPNLPEVVVSSRDVSLLARTYLQTGIVGLGRFYVAYRASLTSPI